MTNPFPGKLTDQEWEAHLAQTIHEINHLNPQPQVDALLDAGWRIAFLEMSPGLEMWQWKWRRPPRKLGGKGMLFISTSQAYNHLIRSKPNA